MSIEVDILRLGGLQPIQGDAFRPMTEAELHEIEAVYNSTMPLDVKAFLKTYGASSFKRRVSVTPVDPFPSHISSTGADSLDAFYGVTDAKLRAYALSFRIQMYRRRLPKNLLPIAGNGNGDQYCVGMSGHQVGKILFWDHHNEFDEEDYLEELGIDLENLDDEDRPEIPSEAWFQNVYLIAASFEDMFARMEVVSEH